MELAMFRRGVMQLLLNFLMLQSSMKQKCDIPALRTCHKRGNNATDIKTCLDSKYKCCVCFLLYIFLKTFFYVTRDIFGSMQHSVHSMFVAVSKEKNYGKYLGFVKLYQNALWLVK